MRQSAAGTVLAVAWFFAIPICGAQSADSLRIATMNVRTGLGVPTNLDEGIAILAAPQLSLRFERVAKIGGVAGIDAGNVRESVSTDTSVVRCDAGFGQETTGVYLNFGHIF